MKLEPPVPLPEKGNEIAALIATLHRTGQRLEELTAGEVDTVADHDGRVFLLQRAQEKLRHGAAEKHAAILNALPANIALLDAFGTITSVNEAWRRFAGANGAQLPGHAVGVNYLGVCDSARGADSSEARQAATGIRSILDGTAQGFSIEYPCHSQAQQRWFLMTVTPAAERHPRGAVVMHLDISQRKQSERELQVFGAAIDALVDAIYLVDRSSMQFVHVNDAACRMMNQPRDRLLAMKPWEILGIPRAELENTYDVMIAGGAEAPALEMLRPREDGKQAWVELRRHAQCSEGRWTIVTLVRDITDRKHAAHRIERLNRVHSVLSGVNTAIVRHQNREELFGEICRIAVSEGQFTAARVIELDLNGKARIAATTALDSGEFQKIIDEYNANPDLSRTLLALGLRSGNPLVSNDVATDLRMPNRAALTRDGTFAFALLPIIVDKRVAGAVTLRARDAGMFDEAELKLLLEVVANLSFALEHIEKETKVRRLTRVHEMLSSINGAIVRIRGRQALFEETCRIAVEAGGLPVAWVGVVGAPGTPVQLAAFAGSDDGFSQTVRNRLAVSDDEPEEHGLSARAIHERRVVVANDVAADPVLSRRKAFADRGIKSVAIFPLFIASRVVGVLALHSEQVGFFDADEMKLLNEVTGNIAFALEHMEKEEKVLRLTRVYAVLSGINTLIVRTYSKDELFKEACRIAIESGGFLKAWLGIVDGSTKQFRMAAAHGGDPAFFQGLEIGLNEKFLAGHGLVVQALATLQPVISNDARADPEVLMKDSVIASGVRSIAILPLVVAGEAVGVFTLNADSPGFFNEEEMKLLVELAGDIAFAIDHIGKRDQLEYLAYYDELTGLANRSLLLERLAQHMRSAVSVGQELALFVLDLERFRNINDSLGRPAGDALLKQVANMLSRSLGDPNLLARLGADQFAIVLPELKRDGNVTHLVESKIRLFLEHQYRVSDTDLRVAIKVGVALFPNDGADAATLLRNAETALKKAKRKGEPYLFYKSKMSAAVAGNLSLENQLREALDKEQFVLHYQPKVNLDTGKLTGAEALIRWNDPRTGLVPPGRFIPVLEETGLIRDVGRWAMRKAIEDYLRWRAAGLTALRIAVNVSPMQLRSRGFIDEIRTKIGIDAHAADGLELEITESLIMEDVEHNIANLKAIRAMGVTIAVDDFGTGFSSLSYLAKLPVDTLKIDRSFVNDMTLSSQGLSLVSTVITLAHSLNLKVVAEGVETEEQSRLLRLLRCDEMQGFLFSKPVPAGIFEEKFLGPSASA